MGKAKRCIVILLAVIGATSVRSLWGQSTPPPPRVQPQKSSAGVAAVVTFHNRGTDSVDLIWVGYDGQEQKMSTIAAGKSITADSAIGHVWKAKAGSQELGSYHVDKAQTEFTVNAPSAAGPIPRIKPAGPPSTTPPAAQTPAAATTAAPPPPRITSPPAAASTAPATAATVAPPPPRIATTPPRTSAPTAGAPGAPTPSQRRPAHRWSHWQGSDGVTFKRTGAATWVKSDGKGNAMGTFTEKRAGQKMVALVSDSGGRVVLAGGAAFEASKGDAQRFALLSKGNWVSGPPSPTQIAHWTGTQNKQTLEFRRNTGTSWSMLVNGQVTATLQETEAEPSGVWLVRSTPNTIFQVYDGFCVGWDTASNGTNSSFAVGNFIAGSTASPQPATSRATAAPVNSNPPPPPPRAP